MKLIPSFVSASAGILVAVAALAAAPAAWAGNLVFSVGFQVPGGHVGHAPAHVQRAPVVVAPQHTYPQHGHGYGHVQAAPWCTMRRRRRTGVPGTIIMAMCGPTAMKIGTVIEAIQAAGSAQLACMDGLWLKASYQAATCG